MHVEQLQPAAGLKKEKSDLTAGGSLTFLAGSGVASFFVPNENPLKIAAGTESALDPNRGGLDGEELDLSDVKEPTPPGPLGNSAPHIPLGGLLEGTRILPLLLLVPVVVGNLRPAPFGHTWLISMGSVYYLTNIQI